MIHHYFTRTFSDGRDKSVCADQQVPKEKMLQYFVDAELHYNSRIVSISDTEVKTTSGCFGCVDDMTFSGPADEMTDLVAIARAYQEAVNGSPAVLHLFTQSKSRQFNEDATEFLTAMASGRKPFSAALWHMLVLKKAVPDTEIKLRDVDAAFQLIYCDGQNPAEVFELAGIAQAA
jgi:hypothetical protein